MRTISAILGTILLALNGVVHADFAPAKTHDGKADLNGIWQAMSSAHWNIEPHPASKSPIREAGAFGAPSGGLGIVEGGLIPYRSDARKQQQANFAQSPSNDPAYECFMPGVPRASYMPYPLQIIQTPKHILIAYEFAQASRTLYIDQPDFEAPVDSWMGHSLAHWEGDTLVVNVSDQVADSWLDRAGNFHSGGLKVEERYTLESPYHLRYEATLTDPEVYTRPWTLSVLLYKNMDKHAQLLDFKCVEFVEDLMYGDLSKEETNE